MRKIPHIGRKAGPCKGGINAFKKVVKHRFYFCGYTRHIRRRFYLVLPGVSFPKRIISNFRGRSSLLRNIAYIFGKVPQ